MMLKKLGILIVLILLYTNISIASSKIDISDDNTNLSVLRLDKEGISPEFDKDIKEYYFIVSNSITDLEVTAIPENIDSIVNISGNKNLKIGKNVIVIEVQSKDKSNTSEYKIYVTRTSDLEKANANLETLAISQVALNPEFDANITQYNIEIPNEMDKLEMLAIPQKENATVTISGNNEMKVGDNKIEIIVLAEDGITSKKYKINVHRRNLEQEKEVEEERKEATRVVARVQANQVTANLDNIQKNDNITNIILAIFIGLIVVGIVITIIYKKRKN